MSFVDQLKKPPVLIIGAGVGILVLIASMRGGTTGTGNTSQFAAIAAQTNVALAGTNAAYNTAVAKIQGDNALAAWNFAKVKAGNDVALQIQSLALVQNLFKVASDASVQDHAISAGVTNQIIKTNADLTADRIMADLKRTTAPIDASTAVSIAQIQSNATIMAAQINAANQQSLANVYASRAYGFGSPGNNVQSLGIAGNGVANLITSLAGLFG
jgi:hypothetical protein